MASRFEIVNEEYIEELKDKSENGNTKNKIVKHKRMMNGGWSSRWVFCDYKLIIPKFCSFVVLYIYFSKVSV